MRVLHTFIRVEHFFYRKSAESQEQYKVEQYVKYEWAKYKYEYIKGMYTITKSIISLLSR